jgi:hypothetical protein
MEARANLYLLVPITGCLAIGCASWFITGGQLADHDLSSGALASYRATTCVQVSDNRPIEPPREVSWHLIRNDDGLKLFERGADGKGTLINNHWQAADGSHYFVRVQRSAWEYVLPLSPAAPALRLVYVGVSTSNESGQERPVGTPTVRCELAATGGGPSVAPAATAANATGENVNGTGAQGQPPSQPAATSAVASPSATSQTTGPAVPLTTSKVTGPTAPGSGDPEATRQISAIMGSGFSAGEHTRAEHDLLEVLIACGNACSPAMNATIWMHVGIVRGVGLHNQKKAIEAFRIGLKLDRNAAPQTSYLDAPTLATYQKARKELGTP